MSPLLFDISERRRFFAIAALLLFAASLMTTMYAHRLSKDGLNLRASAQALQFQLNRATSSPFVETRRFADQLPPTGDAREFVQKLLVSANTNGVVLQSVATSTEAATMDRLGQVTLALDLKGSYPAIKAVVAEMIERTPSLVIKSLSLRRRGPPTEVEAHADVVLLTHGQERP